MPHETPLNIFSGGKFNKKAAATQALLREPVVGK
jgi:hypothetical protein